MLSSCPKALAEGRYRWRHDQVLKAVAETVASAITTSKHPITQRRALHLSRLERRIAPDAKFNDWHSHLSSRLAVVN